MAEKKVFSVYDIKAELFGPPFFTNREGEAVRMFKDAANDPNTMVGKHPSDYKLCCIATWDDESGEFESKTPPTLMGSGIDYVNLGTTIPIGVAKGA